MIINNNMASLNTYNKLNSNTAATAKSLEKLSSGLRINKAGDDAAGLAISEKMRGQIRGLDQAARNSQDGISMLQTAEGSLSETHSILQRMKELATQSANDTNVNSDRNEIQKEINQLSSEINRIGNTTEFNTKSLLKGDGGVTLGGIGIATASLGKLTGGTDRVTTEATVTLTVGTAAAAASTAAITINGQTLTATFQAAGTGGQASHVGYGISSGGTATTANINIDGTQTVDETAAGLRDAYQKMIDANAELKGNYVVSGTGAGVTISAVKGAAFEGNKGVMSAYTAGGTDITTSGSAGLASTGTTTAAVQASKTLTMPLDATVAAGLLGKGMTINGVNLEFYDATKGAYTGSAQGIDIGGITTKTTLTDAIVAQAKVEGVVLSNATGDLKVTAAQGGLAGNNINTADGGVQADFKASFQVGASMGQGFTIDIKDMRSIALGITGTASATDSASGAKFASSNVVTNGTDSINREASLDVSNNTNATNAIKVLDNAIQKVSAERSKLGAFTNRLEHTIANLGTSSENLTGAESRIRDVDMAKEMMQFQKNNILAQAATAMLAQANQQPQGVLQLLR